MPTPEDFLRPPYLFKGWKWFIIWEEFKPGTTEKIRIRKTFDLNRAYLVADPKLRERRAAEILQKKTLELSGTQSKAIVVLGQTNIVQAIDLALNIKSQTDREHTKVTYTSFRNIFVSWLNFTGLNKLPIAYFTRKNALEFMDYVLLERKTKVGKPIGNRTFNNYLINMRALFFELVQRGYIVDNPFSNHRPRKEEQKIRQPFSQHDSDAIADYVYRQNKAVYLAILLVSHCGLRISEIRRMRARDIDMDRGLISLSGAQTKNKERAYITIPSSIIPILNEFELHQIPGQYLVFGLHLRPHPKLSCGRNTISDRFREMLSEMVEKNIIQSRTGYTTYSWKDTGAIAMVKAGVDIVAIQKHLRHKSLATTQKYLQSLGVINNEIRNFTGVIFRLPKELQKNAATSGA
jgi:integrase